MEGAFVVLLVCVPLSLYHHHHHHHHHHQPHHYVFDGQICSLPVSAAAQLVRDHRLVRKWAESCLHHSNDSTNRVTLAHFTFSDIFLRPCSRFVKHNFWHLDQNQARYDSIQMEPLNKHWYELPKSASVMKWCNKCENLLWSAREKESLKTEQMIWIPRKGKHPQSAVSLLSSCDRRRGDVENGVRGLFSTTSKNDERRAGQLMLLLLYVLGCYLKKE